MVVLSAQIVSPLIAGTDYSDGASHTVSTASSDITLQNGTTLTVAAGAQIAAPDLTPGVFSGDGTKNHVFVTGGTVHGGGNPAAFGGFGSAGISMFMGTLDISGGVLTGGNASFVPGAAVGTFGVDVTISGGDFAGGDNFGFDYPGAALVASDGEILITGGIFHAANSNQQLFDDAMVRFGVSPGPTHALITGGTFDVGSHVTNSLAVGFSYAATVDLQGGQFTGGFELAIGGSVLNVYGHSLTMNLLETRSNLEIKHVSGVLLDGSPLSVDAVVYEGAALNLFNVPEPGSLALAACGIALLSVPFLRRPAVAAP